MSARVSVRVVVCRCIRVVPYLTCVGSRPSSGGGKASDGGRAPSHSAPANSASLPRSLRAVSRIGSWRGGNRNAMAMAAPLTASSSAPRSPTPREGGCRGHPEAAQLRSYGGAPRTSTCRQGLAMRRWAQVPIQCTMGTSRDRVLPPLESWLESLPLLDAKVSSILSPAQVHIYSKASEMHVLKPEDSMCFQMVHLRDRWPV